MEKNNSNGFVVLKSAVGTRCFILKIGQIIQLVQMFQSDLLGKDECDFVFKKKKRLASLGRAPGEVRPLDSCAYGAWRGRTTMGDLFTSPLIPNRLHFTLRVLLCCYARAENEIVVTKKREGSYSPYFPPVFFEKRGLKSITPVRNYGCYR